MLGNGTFGLVIQARDNEAQPPVDVAIKLLPRGNFIKNFKTYVNREILHQSSLKHPFIISLREVRHMSSAHGPSCMRDGVHGCWISLVHNDQGYPTVRFGLLCMSYLGLSGMSEVQVFLTPKHLAIAMEYAKGGNLFHYLLQHGPHCRLTEAKAQWIFQQLIIGLDYCHRRVCSSGDPLPTAKSGQIML